METVQELQPLEESMGGYKNLDEVLNVLFHGESSEMNTGNQNASWVPITNLSLLRASGTTDVKRTVHKKELD